MTKMQSKYMIKSTNQTSKALIKVMTDQVMNNVTNGNSK